MAFIRFNNFPDVKQAKLMYRIFYGLFIIMLYYKEANAFVSFLRDSAVNGMMYQTGYLSASLRIIIAHTKQRLTILELDNDIG